MSGRVPVPPGGWFMRDRRTRRRRARGDRERAALGDVDGVTRCGRCGLPFDEDAEPDCPFCGVA